MTQIDFYILPQEDIFQRHLFACRLVEKAYRLGHGVYIHSDDEAQANALDQLLWQFRDSSFVPHQCLHEQHRHSDDATTPAGAAPVQIGYASSLPPETAADQLLVNLSHNVPEFFSRFERVCEIVVQHPQIQAATRDNFRFYRQRGYPLHTHDLKK